MNVALIIVVVLIGGAALFVALNRCCGKAKTSGGDKAEDFVEAANAASRAARHSLAEGLGSPLSGRGDQR